MEYAILAFGGLLLAGMAWKQGMIVQFFRRSTPQAATPPRLISILQPIVSGDPTLARCLEHCLSLSCAWPIEVLWLVDEADTAAQQLCRELIARHPGRDVRVLLLPAPPDRHSPKMFKLIEAMKEARGDVICVLDDDTMLPAGGLETSIAGLDEPGAGLAFGLPYYVRFDSFWSSIVACFVNSHSLMTYVPYTFLLDPITINGMFYVFRRAVYESTGGFAGVVDILADDFAAAKHFRGHGYRLIQTSVRHPISTHVSGPRAYLRLLHRWLTFPRETLLKALPWRELAITHGLTLMFALGPMLLLIASLLWPATKTFAMFAAVMAYHFAIFLHCNFAYLRRATPWYWWWLVPLIQLVLPLQILAAILLPQRVNWRGHVMQIERGGSFRYLRRRGA
jgi:ceramide glucosyltransferase